ncbi:MAG: IS5 family transposase [Lautropia sp.]
MRVPDIFRQPLIELLNPKHELVRLADAMDWALIERSFGSHFSSATGRPALPPRLVAGLLYLQHAYDCSDEIVVNTWIENSYWQYYTGETYFPTEAPIGPSSLTRWRERVGEEGVETILMATIEAGRKLGLLRERSVDRVIVDTTVMPKAGAHPTDSRLLEKSRQHLVKLAADEGIKLRQNYNREAPRLAAQIGPYAHAKQYRRMKKSLRTPRSRAWRVLRDMDRKLENIDPSSRAKAREVLNRANRILTQKTKDKNKLYAFHAPEVECIAKGKARTPYEFGARATIATTLKEGFVVGMRSTPSNPYDGHTLAETLEQVGILATREPKVAIVDRGYRGVDVEGVQILRSGQKRGITRTLHKMIKRRSAIEPTIGHMKNDGRLDQNWLKETLGDTLHAALCGAGHNIRLLLRKLRLLCACSVHQLIALLGLRHAPVALGK